MSPFQKLLEHLDLLEEKKGSRRKSVPKSKFIDKSEDKRKERAKNVVIVTESAEEVNKNITRHLFEVTSAEKSESKTHDVILEMFTKSGRVDSATCSCADFASRFAFYRNKDGINPWNERVEAKNEIFEPHNKEFPIIMNPDDDMGYSCKHIIACIMRLQEEGEE